jgi:hypothetical protein
MPFLGCLHQDDERGSAFVTSGGWWISRVGLPGWSSSEPASLEPVGRAASQRAISRDHESAGGRAASLRAISRDRARVFEFSGSDKGYGGWHGPAVGCDQAGGRAASLRAVSRDHESVGGRVLWQRRRVRRVARSRCRVRPLWVVEQRACERSAETTSLRVVEFPGSDEGYGGWHRPAVGCDQSGWSSSEPASDQTETTALPGWSSSELASDQPRPRPEPGWSSSEPASDQPRPRKRTAEKARESCRIPVPVREFGAESVGARP